MLEHLVERVEQRRRDLVADRQRFQACQAGIFQLVDAPLEVAFDQDVLVFVDNPLVVGMLVHDIDAYAFLLVLVDLQVIGQLLQFFEFVVRDALVFEIELLEGIVVLLVLFMDQLDQVERAAMTEHAVDLVDQLRVIAEPDMNGTLEGFAEQAGDILLLLLQLAGDRSGHKEEIVDRGIAFEEELLVAALPVGLRGEVELAAITLVEGPVKDQAVAHVGFRQVGERLVDAEHVLAEGAAIAAVADLPGLQDELVARREEAQVVTGGFEEIAAVGVA